MGQEPLPARKGEHGMKKTTLKEQEHIEVFGAPDEETLFDMAELFKVFADSTRIRILYAMFDSEMNVSQICDKVEMSISAVSHQLRLLKQAKLVRCRREGRKAYYMLADDHVKTIIGMAKEHIEED